MNIYVGRWDLLPAEWEGYNGLSEKSEEEIYQEVKREWLESGDNFIECYSPEEFEETFNQCLSHFIDSNTYWIKIF